MHASKANSYVKRVNKSCAVSCLLVRLKKSLIHMQVEEDQAAPRSPKWDTDESVQLCVVLLAAWSMVWCWLISVKAGSCVFCLEGKRYWWLLVEPATHKSREAAGPAAVSFRRPVEREKRKKDAQGLVIRRGGWRASVNNHSCTVSRCDFRPTCEVSRMWDLIHRILLFQTFGQAWRNIRSK